MQYLTKNSSGGSPRGHAAHAHPLPPVCSTHFCSEWSEGRGEQRTVGGSRVTKLPAGMELLYLMGSIAYSSLTSSILSIYLAFSSLLSCFRPANSTTTNGRDEAVAPALQLYEGVVHHVRRRPAYHAFEYPVRYALLDLDRCAADPPPFPLSGHLSADQARSITGTDGPVLLLTMPMSVGYEQNPLSVYYCFDRDDNMAAAPGDGGDDGEAKGTGETTRLKKCIAEVTNTPWGERVTFIFNPGSDLVAKPLHVSPFMDMLGNWSMHTDIPGNKLFLAISVQHPTLGTYFTATLNAKRVSTTSSSIRPAIFFWLMPQKVAVWIYWQALKLWWKSVSFIQHPKHVNPTYRQDALLRNQELYSQRNGQNKSNHDNAGNSSMYTSNGNKEARWCVWRDAEWPWA